MMDIRNRDLMQNYTRQYGWIMRKGAKNLHLVLLRYVENGCTATSRDYSRFIREAAAELGIRPASFLSTIDRFVKSGWNGKQNFMWEWSLYAGWNESTPPTPAVAIRLVCEAYVPFVRKYEEVIRNQRSYFLHMDIEAFEKGEWKPKRKLEDFFE